MKVFLQFSIATALALSLVAVSLGAAGSYFIKDMVELHGSQWAGGAVRIKDASINRSEKNFLLQDVCFTGTAESQALCIGSAVVQLPPDFSIEWRRASFLPDFLTVEYLDIKDVSVFYDIDSEGGDLRKLKFNLSEKSSIAMKDRLNAKAQGANEILLLQVKSLKVSGIKVEARSRKNPGRSKDFFIDNLVVADLSMQENGIASAEILDQVVSVVVDRVQREAKKQGLIESSSVSEGGQSSRKRAATTADGRGADSEEESGASKTVRSIGADLKKTGSDLWQGTKNLFD
jgi:hypothetical protein